jgi:tRNA1Val (adenine37-N6)-methyltransferase
MKVGMDSLLLGSWVDPPSKGKILDIGAGCGILSLMMASKSESEIDAVELDQASTKEAEKNFFCSPFHRRLKVVNDDIVSFADHTKNRYDLVITNPPFFFNDQKSSTQRRLYTRHTEALSYESLIDVAVKIMDKDGQLCLVLPYEESKDFILIAQSSGIYLQKLMLIFPIRGHPPNRVNMKLGFNKVDPTIEDLLNIREEGGSYSQEYKKQVFDFMINIR